MAQKTAAKSRRSTKTTAKKAAPKRAKTAKKAPTKTAKKAVKKKTAKRASTKAKAKASEEEVKIDRRREGRRAEASAEAKPTKETAEKKPALERRQKVNRRRQIDPTTCERDYSDSEVEFMNALDEYKRKSGRMFPTCSEVLEVIRELGYVQLTPAELSARKATETPDLEEAAEQEANEALEESLSLRTEEDF